MKTFRFLFAIAFLPIVALAQNVNVQKASTTNAITADLNFPDARTLTFGTTTPTTIAGASGSLSINNQGTGFTTLYGSTSATQARLDISLLATGAVMTKEASVGFNLTPLTGGTLQAGSVNVSFPIDASAATGWTQVAIHANDFGGGGSNNNFRVSSAHGILFNTSDVLAAILGTWPGPGFIKNVGGLITGNEIQAGGSSGGLRLEGATALASATGPGLEAGYSSGGASSFIQSYNRTTSAFGPMQVYGTTVTVGTGAGATSAIVADASQNVTIGANILRFSSTNGIQGTNTNNNAAAGYYGEFSSSTIASGSSVALTTATTANVTSISLTAGDWNVWGNVYFAQGATTTATAYNAGVSQTSATLPGNDAGDQVNLDGTGAALLVGNPEPTLTMPVARISLAGTTTVYLTAQSTFLISTQAAYGTLRARRIR